MHRTTIRFRLRGWTGVFSAAVCAWLVAGAAVPAAAPGRLMPVSDTGVSDEPGSGAGGPGHAGPDHAAQAGVEAPDTPAGRALKKVLAHMADPEAELGAADFEEAFNKQVPPAQLKQVLSGMRGKYGALVVQRIEPGATPTRLVAVVRGEKSAAHLRISIVTSEAGVMSGLLFTPAPELDAPPITSWADLDAALTPLAQQAGFAAVEILSPEKEGEAARLRPVHALNGDRALALGSAFKLWVLGALGELVQSAGAKWDEQIPIRESLKSLPGGVMQNEADGTNFSLREFASRMISISDNTATDHLLARVGREKVEAEMARRSGTPERNRPFLSTRDIFVLKLSPGSDLPERYLKADEADRRAMIGPDGEVTKGSPNLLAAGLWITPRWIDRIEWFATPMDMCGVMADLKSRFGAQAQAPIRDILSINPGLPLDRKVWTYIGYKGGSEPGVLNMTWLLQRDDGRWFAASFGLNDTAKAVDESRLMGVAVRGLQLLGREGRGRTEDGPKPDSPR